MLKFATTFLTLDARSLTIIPRYHQNMPNIYTDYTQHCKKKLKIFRAIQTKIMHISKQKQVRKKILVQSCATDS
jgi:hypothetical protein